MKKLTASAIELIVIATLAWLGFSLLQEKSITSLTTETGLPAIQKVSINTHSDPVQEAAQNAIKALAETAKNVVAPEPLRAQEESATSNLSQNGTLTWTNAARRANGGLKPLTLNAELNAAASAKVRDMFAQQYFAHVSPSGVGPGDLAEQAGYAFISVGENLALGNFADDQALVQAWMDSPGHRANILGHYSEIGIAVGRGTYQGETTWLAVQEFGRPASECAGPDPALKAKIAEDKATLNSLADQADSSYAELNALPKPKTKAETAAYNAKVDAYNALVKQIRDLTNQVNGEVTVYNGQTQAFNACAQ